MNVIGVRARYDPAAMWHTGLMLTEQSHTLRVLSASVRGALAQARKEAALFAGRYEDRLDLVYSVESACDRLEGVNAQLSELAPIAERLADVLRLAREQIEQNESSLERFLRQFRDELKLLRRPQTLLSSVGFTASLRALASHVDWVTAAAISFGPTPLLLPASSRRVRRGPNLTAGAFVSVTDRFTDPRARVSVRSEGATTAVTAPRSLADLARRIPDAQAGKPQLRIERYQNGGKPTWVVYSSGTIDMTPNARGEPWDGASNLKLMAGMRSDSLRAAQQAMRAAGIVEGDHVVHVGFSQGGMLAATLAAQAPPGTADLVTFGAPVAQVDLQNVDAAITIEHAEDLVPALGGVRDVRIQDRVSITQRVFGGELPEGETLPAHNLKRYIDTAVRVDAETGVTLRDEQRKLFDDFAVQSGQSERCPNERVTNARSPGFAAQ